MTGSSSRWLLISVNIEKILILAKELEIRPDLLYRLRRKALESQEASFPGQGNPKQTAEEKEIVKLKKELRETQLERDILKKAVSIFSKNDVKYSNS